MQRKGEKKNYNLYRGYKLFLSENWFEVMRVDYGIASISLFRIYVLPSSMSIQFNAKISKTESDDKVKL